MDKTPLDKEKAEIALSNLVKLREKISDIESRFNVLTANYTGICSEAILKVIAVKAALEEEPSWIKSKNLEAVNPEVSNLEAEFKLGLIPVETCMKERAARPSGPRVLIDKTADLIELSLDKIGDGIIALGEKIAAVTSNISRFVPQK